MARPNDELLGELIAAVGAASVRRGENIPDRHRADVSGLPPVCPAALVLPRTVEEVCAVVAACHRHCQPIVVQGGMTGAAGGAHPQEGEIALSLERLSGIEEIDAHSATLTALAGTPLAAVQQAAADAGFSCGIDLGARASATIGGIASTNAGGTQVVRYGMARRNIVGLQVVLADGTLVSGLNKMMKNNTGYDWTQLFLGAEGTLGIVTRVVVALQPPQGEVQSALLAVPGTEEALALLRHARRRLPSEPLAFEVMWSEYYRLATSVAGLSSPLRGDSDCYVLVETTGGGGVPEAFEGLLAQALDEGLVVDAVIAKSIAERHAFWALREASYRFGTLLPPQINFDISFPLDRMAEAIGRLRVEVPSLSGDIVWAIFGHLADGNVHIMVMTPRKAELKAAVEACVYGITVSLSGSISAEHGIGRLKRPWLLHSRSAAELALMERLKTCLDPLGLLNPGRVVDPRA